MAKIEVTINNVAYPCRPTMGAALRFKKETGKEITEIDPNSFTDLCTYLYCCVASASAADGISFNMSLMDFADAINPDEMTEWASSMQKKNNTTTEGADGEKKS